MNALTADLLLAMRVEAHTRNATNPRKHALALGNFEACREEWEAAGCPDAVADALGEVAGPDGVALVSTVAGTSS